MTQNKYMKPLSSFVVILMCGWLQPFSSLAIDRASKKEFSAKRREVNARYQDFYARKKRIQEKRLKRKRASAQQMVARSAFRKKRQKHRKAYKRPIPLSDEKGVKIFESIQADKRARYEKRRKDYALRIRSIRASREGRKKLPELEEFGIQNYEEVIWSKEKGPEKRGR